MDGTDHGSVTAEEPALTPEQRVELAAAAALNDQAMLQLAHLAHGPLAFGALEAFKAAALHLKGATATVLQVRVVLDERLYTLVVQVVVSPQS